MSFEEASTIPCVFMTSKYALHRLAGLQKGDSVLIHSAAGGVGIAAIQLAQYKGAQVRNPYLEYKPEPLTPSGADIRHCRNPGEAQLSERSVWHPRG